MITGAKHRDWRVRLRRRVLPRNLQTSSLRTTTIPAKRHRRIDEAQRMARTVRRARHLLATHGVGSWLFGIGFSHDAKRLESLRPFLLFEVLVNDAVLLPNGPQLVELEADHPGFNDAAYRRRRNEIAR